MPIYLLAETISCDDLNTLLGVVDSVIKIIRVAIPVALLLFGSIDLGKAVIASKDDEIKKAQATLLKRVIAGAAIFLLGVIINLALSLVPGVYKNCDEAQAAAIVTQVQLPVEQIETFIK